MRSRKKKSGISAVKPQELRRRSKRAVFGIHHGDARALSRTLPDSLVDTTITSPPYFDLKDYGRKKQIGFGQSYETYLSDLASVFKEVYRATTAKGSLWVIVDTFRRGQEVCPLPFDLAGALRPAGWTLRDVIIWKKERTVPWIHEGKTKKIFEYILVFGKIGQTFRHFPDRLRDHASLRRWWVKYPERYNPAGKALEEIWNFDIPVQGSWGNDQVRHYCPLPPALIGRIIDLTTSKNDVVLDPFAGSGAVLLEATARGRRAIGFELNHHYIQKFKAFARSSKSNSSKAPDRSQQRFRVLVLQLRLLKFGRLLHRKLTAVGLLASTDKILVRQLRVKPKSSVHLQAVEYSIYSPGGRTSQILRAASELCAKRPLSKYGIEPHLRVASSAKDFPTALGRKQLFGYSAANSHKVAAKLLLKDIPDSPLAIFSPLKVHVEEPHD